jgi:hypothetical protein
MAKIDFYKIDEADKAAIFTQIATEKGMTAFAVEKDWWAFLLGLSNILLIFAIPKYR